MMDVILVLMVYGTWLNDNRCRWCVVLMEPWSCMWLLVSPITFNYSIEHNFDASMIGKFSFIYINHYLKQIKSCLITFQEHSNNSPRTRIQIAPPTKSAKLSLKMQLLIVRLDPNYSHTHTQEIMFLTSRLKMHTDNLSLFLCIPCYSSVMIKSGS